VVSQAATLTLKARRSNNIKVFIEFILNRLLCFAFSHIDDIEFTGVKTKKILDFGPIGSVLLQVGQFEDGYAAFEGMPDQDVLGDQCGLTLRLSMSRPGTRPKDEQNEQKQGGIEYFQCYSLAEQHPSSGIPYKA
jgi:hypothetical protein